MKGVVCRDLKVEIYDVILNIVVSDTVYQCLKYIDNKLPYGLNKQNLEGTHAMFFINRKTNNWVLAFNKSKISRGTIAHECFHATVRIMHEKGITTGTNFEAEEAYAYLLGFLVDKVSIILNDITNSDDDFNSSS